VIDQAETLSLPTSVVEFFAGALGVPYGGFPEPLRTRILHGHAPIEGRPGASMPPLDFDALLRQLRDAHGPHIREVDVLSAAMYPKVFAEFMAFREPHSDVSVMPTRAFFGPVEVGEEFTVEIERGKALIIRMRQIGPLRTDGTREVYYELNGRGRSVRVRDEAASKTLVVRERANTAAPGSIGAPMPGAVVEVRTAAGAQVEVGTPLVVLSAMKMETVVASPVAGVVERLVVTVGDTMAAGDLLCVVTPRAAATG
jgi:pyruvate carboxylase